MIHGDRKLRWSVVQRGFWVHGANDLQGYLQRIEAFTMDGRGGPMPARLLPLAQSAATAGTPHPLDALRCPKDLIRFSAAECAGGHCEMMNRCVLDWLDRALALNAL